MRKLLVTIVVLSGLVLFAGCGDDDDPVAVGTNNALVGSWQGIVMVCDGGPAESIEDQFVTFLADRNGTVTDGGISFDITWSTSGNQLSITLTLVSETAVGTYSVVEDVWNYTVVSDGETCIYTYGRT